MMWQEKNWDMRGSLWQGLASTIWGEALRAEPLLAVGGVVPGVGERSDIRSYHVL